jgi:hypothetical protein
MTMSTEALPAEPVCVIRLLDRLDRVANDFAEDVPLGPYIVEALTEDVVLCPALTEEAESAASIRLDAALDAARRAVGIRRACPAIEPNFAATCLGALAVEARQRLAARKQEILDRLGDLPAEERQSALEAALKSARCASCAFI